MMTAPFSTVDPDNTAWRDATANESTALVLGSFSEDGHLRYANAGMRRLLKLDDGRFDPAYFRSPNFATFRAHVPGREPVYAGLVTIHDGREVGNSIQAAVFRRDDCIHVIGEYNVTELTAINDQMHDLNREVTRLHRESARQTRELQKALRELQEGQAERERLQRELVEISRRAGRAEVAVGVLHNVGNTLNGVLVSAALISETVQSGQLSSLRKVVGLLEKHQADLPGFLASPQGCQLLPYLQVLSGKMLDEREQLLDETRGMNDRLNGLVQFVDGHRKYGQQTAVIERVDLAQIVEDVLPAIVETQQSKGIEISLSERKASITDTDPFRVRGLLQELVAASVTLASAATEVVRIVVSVRAAPDPTMQITIAGLVLTDHQCSELIRPRLDQGTTINLHDAANTATQLKAQLNITAEPAVGTTIAIRFQAPGDDSRQLAPLTTDRMEIHDSITSTEGN